MFLRHPFQLLLLDFKLDIKPNTLHGYIITNHHVELLGQNLTDIYQVKENIYRITAMHTWNLVRSSLNF